MVFTLNTAIVNHEQYCSFHHIRLNGVSHSHQKPQADCCSLIIVAAVYSYSEESINSWPSLGVFGGCLRVGVRQWRRDIMSLFF